MGLFSGIFGRKNRTVSGRNPSKSWVYANRFNKARGGFAGGWGAVAFGNIIEAHSSAEDIVEEFELYSEECKYRQPNGMTCWRQAYQEALREVMFDAFLMGVSPETLIDYEEVEEQAYEYALELAQLYIDGEIWIPTEIIEWAYYDVSDHNN